ncbi:MAG: dicarboxylate/amino acid:cation symporter [Kangiellaceae bacterium]|jgi:Na+/H+-dicarboxylate symporter|nr:dicarboxylate/amino acid:cation symporter [Kangiellaceae bacterium]
MLQTFRSMSLSAQIFSGLFLGIVFGALLSSSAAIFPGSDSVIANYLIPTFDVVKKLFINALKMVVVPLVLVSLICGTCSLSDPKKLGSLGGKSIALYLLTTAIAITLALVFANLFNPGVGVTVADTGYQVKNAPSLSEVISDLVTDNPFKSMASGNMLQVIIFAILFGIAISRAGESGKKVAEFFNSMNEVILKLVTIIMHIAPYGVFAIMTSVIYSTGLDSIANLITYFLLVAGTLILHAVVTYPSMLLLFSGLSPLTLFTKMRPALLFAFSTSSSAATLPVTMEVARKRLGVGKTTASFSLPLGATINMDGTAVMQGIATVFIAQTAGVDLTMTQYLTVILMATLASIGTAGVPSVGLVMLTIVLTQVNLPSEAIGMLLGIDRFLDMMRTAVNITGDATVACIVSKSENDFDKSVFDDPKAGADFEGGK